MGTNYYLRYNECNKCKQHDKIHIGKSSYGWQFVFYANDWKYFKGIKELKKWLKSSKIYDEYGKKTSFKAFWTLVEGKKNTVEPELKEDERVLMGYEILDGYKFYNREFS